MSTADEPGRVIEVSRPIAARPQDVWQALVDPRELVAWYAEDAEVEPREGGRYLVRWGEGVEGASVINEWEPPHRLKIVHVDRGGSREAELDRPITEEFTVEPHEQVSLVRVLQGRIPGDPEWDSYVDAEQEGWQIALMALEAHLEDGDRVARAQLPIRASFDVSATTAWNKLVGPDGLALGDAAVERPFDVVAGIGQRLRGLMWSWSPPVSFMARIDEPGPAYLSAAVDAGAGRLSLRWSCYAWTRSSLDQHERRWAQWLPFLFELET